MLLGELVSVFMFCCGKMVKSMMPSILSKSVSRTISGSLLSFGGRGGGGAALLIFFFALERSFFVNDDVDVCADGGGDGGTEWNGM